MSNETINKILNELQYDREQIFSGVEKDFDNEENASPVYDPIYLTHETPTLTKVVQEDLKKPTIPQQLEKE